MFLFLFDDDFTWFESLLAASHFRGRSASLRPHFRPLPEPRQHEEQVENDVAEKLVADVSKLRASASKAKRNYHFRRRTIPL